LKEVKKIFNSKGSNATGSYSAGIYSTGTYKTLMELQGREVQVSIKAMKRKSLRLGINEAGDVEVKVPLRCPTAEIVSFLNKHTDWLEERLQQFEKTQLRLQQQMLYLGKTYQFRCSKQSHRQPVLIESICYYPHNWASERLLEKVEAWQREQAKEIFQQLIDRWWPQFSHGALISRPILRVKKMRSRWGSLSSKGYINLNLKLIELAPELIEMVVVHELCHSHYFDHSANFYRLMAAKLPHYKALEAQLRSIEKGCVY
jgi:predicted metal-dependent hydrolase